MTEIKTPAQIASDIVARHIFAQGTTIAQVLRVVGLVEMGIEADRAQRAPVAHDLVRVWNEGASANFTYAYRCLCGHVDRDYIWREYAVDGQREHAREAAA